MAKIYQSFDDIYTVFMDISRIDEFMLPRTPEGMYALLEQGIDRYSIYYDNAKEIVFDRITETLNTEIEYEDVQIIANYMLLIVYEKIRDEFISTYDVLVDDIGIRSYKSQVDAKETAIELQNKKIQKLLLKLSDNFDVVDDII